MQELTHNECIYAPGDADAVKAFFGALGLSLTNVAPHPYIIAHVNPSQKDVIGNVLYASELTPLQQAFEQTLKDALARSEDLRVAAEDWERDFREDPQRSVHFGLRYDTQAAFEEALGRLREVGGPGGALEGRVLVTGVYYPGDPGSLTDVMAQGFVWTDVLASGILTFGQHIELQWHIKPMVLD